MTTEQQYTKAIPGSSPDTARFWEKLREHKLELPKCTNCGKISYPPRAICPQCMSLDLEYAIKQDIRNNPVVREVDTAQKRELLRTLGWAAACVAMLIFALVPRATAVNDGYEMQQLRDHLAAEDVLQRKYRLELETLLAPALLQQRGAELRMMLPTERTTIVLERVNQPASDSRAILAAAR